MLAELSRPCNQHSHEHFIRLGACIALTNPEIAMVCLRSLHPAVIFVGSKKVSENVAINDITYITVPYLYPDIWGGGVSDGDVDIM